MWHVALESWQWIHQVTAPCNVIRGSGMTCHWICPNVRHIEILHLVSISTHHRSRQVVGVYQSAKFYPNRTTLGRKNDVMSSSVEKIHLVGTMNNVETSYFTQLKMCYLMTTFRCPSDILITSWLFTAWWSTWPGNHLVPCVAEL